MSKSIDSIIKESIDFTKSFSEINRLRKERKLEKLTRLLNYISPILSLSICVVFTVLLYGLPGVSADDHTLAIAFDITPLIIIGVVLFISWLSEEDLQEVLKYCTWIFTVIQSIIAIIMIIAYCIYLYK